MLEVLWATLALCALALTGGVLAMLLSQRKVFEKAAQSLDCLNKELPAILDSARLATQDAEALLSMLGTMGRTAAWAGGIFKGLRAIAGIFRGAQPMDKPRRSVMNDRESSGSMVSAFLAGSALGAAVGALAGVLLAPRSGKQTREAMVDSAEEWAERARHAAERAKHAAETAYVRAKDGVFEGRDLAEQEVEAAKAAWKAGRDAWQKVHDGHGKG